MTRKEVSDLLERIQANRQSFLITPSVLREWFNVLEPYDDVDVNKKLDEYFKDSDNFGRFPDAYYITKYLKTVEEKKIVGVNYVLCQLCWKKIKFEDYHNHYERCSSVEYLVEMSERYLQIELNKEELFSLSYQKFEKYYYSTCKKIYNKMPDGFPKHLLENVLLTHEGKTPNCSLEKVKENMTNDSRIS